MKKRKEKKGDVKRGERRSDKGRGGEVDASEDRHGRVSGTWTGKGRQKEKGKEMTGEWRSEGGGRRKEGGDEYLWRNHSLPSVVTMLGP